MAEDKQTETLHLNYEAGFPRQFAGLLLGGAELSGSWEARVQLRPSIKEPTKWAEVPTSVVESTVDFVAGRTSRAKGLIASVAQCHKTSWIDANMLQPSAQVAFLRPEPDSIPAGAWPQAADIPGLPLAVNLRDDDSWNELSQVYVDEHLACEQNRMSHVAVDLTRDAEEFIARNRLTREFHQAREIVERTFPGLMQVDVVLETDPEDDSSQPTLILGVTTRVSSVDFRTARRRFFRTLRWLGCSLLCESLALVRE